MNARLLRLVTVMVILAALLSCRGFATKKRLPDMTGSVFAVAVIDASLPAKGSRDGECPWATSGMPLLGPPSESTSNTDEDSVPLGEDGFIVVRMGAPFTNGDGTDLRIHASPAGREYYNVSVSSDGRKWIEVAQRVCTDTSKLWYRSIDFGRLEGVFEYVRIDSLSDNDCRPYIHAIEALWPTAAPVSKSEDATKTIKSTHEAYAFADDFDDVLSGWETQAKKDDGYDYRNREFAFWTSELSVALWSWAPMGKTRLPDFRAEATAYKATGGDDAEYGIIWGIDNRNFYVFKASADGWYTVQLLEDDEWQTPPVDWTKSDAIRQGEESNTLEVVVEDGCAALIVNGEELRFIDLAMVGPYKIGIMCGTYETVPVEVRFTRFSLKEMT